MRVLLWTVTLIAAGWLPPTQTSQPNDGAIEGRVLRLGSLEPVPNVQVTLVAASPASATSNLSPDVAAALATQVANLIESGMRAGVPQEAIDNAVANAQRNAGAVVGPQSTALTDGAGHFSFKNLAPGRYTLRAQRDGYFGAPFNGMAPLTANASVTLRAGQPSGATDLFLTRGGIISGRVRDPNGQPVSAISVVAYRLTYTNGRVTWSTANSKVTDDRGEYRIFWLPPGEYFIGATPRAAAAVPGPQDTWMRTFFPGTTEPTNATPIVVKDASETPSIDLNIQTGFSNTFKISGTAINPYARPNPTTGAVDRSIGSFILSPREPGLLDTLNPPASPNAVPLASRTNGEFEIRNARPGSYDLYPLYLDPGPPAAAATAVPGGTPLPPLLQTRRYLTSPTPVEVRGDVTGLVISVNPGVTLSGEVVATGSSAQPIKFDSLRISLRSQSTMPDQFASVIGALQVDAAGRFSAPNVPASRYSLQIVGIPATAYVADVRQGGVSVFDTGFDLSESPDPIQVVLDAGGITVEGSVATRDRKPAANATVVLVPPAARRKNAMMYKNVLTDENGRFTIRGVRPGDYTVFAWENIFPTAWQNAEFLSKYQERGRPVNVAPLSQPDVQLELIPAEEK